MDSLIKVETWTPVKLPSGCKPIACCWVFKIKRDENGNVERCKARLVIKECSQVKNFDYSETYAPVAQYESVRILLTIIKS